MAELLGAIASGITLVGLFKACVDAFDMIQYARHQDIDYRKLALRLNIEKCRLYTWGESMRLTTERRGHTARPLEGHDFEAVIRETLEMIVILFHDSDKLRDVYGCKPSGSEQAKLAGPMPSDPIDKLATAFKNFKVKHSEMDPASRCLQKSKWAIHDRKKFTALIAEVKNFIDGLQEITNSVSSVSYQERKMNRAITSIRDIKTHLLLADVCEDDYPEISYISSRATEAASLLPENLDRVNEWTLEVQASGNDATVPTDVEAMTITELKHRLLQLMQSETNSNLHLHRPRMPLPVDIPGPPTQTSPADSRLTNIAMRANDNSQRSTTIKRKRSLVLPNPLPNKRNLKASNWQMADQRTLEDCTVRTFSNVSDSLDRENHGLSHLGNRAVRDAYAEDIDHREENPASRVYEPHKRSLLDTNENERLRRELDRLLTENEILRATSAIECLDKSEVETAWPINFGDDDPLWDSFRGQEDLSQHPKQNGRAFISEDADELLLSANATWDYIQEYEPIYNCIVDVEKVMDRLKKVARTDGSGLVFCAGDVRRAIEKSAVFSSEANGDRLFQKLRR